MQNMKYKGSLLVIMILVIGCGMLLVTGCSNKTNEETNNNGNGIIDDNSKYLSISTLDLVIDQGSTKTFDITLSNAVGRFDVTSDDSNIASVDEEMLWLEGISQEGDKATVTVTGNQVGNTKLVVNLSDVASFDTEEELTGSYIINVTVK